MGLSICLLVCLSVCTQDKKTRFSQKLSNLELWSLLTTYRKSYMGFSKNPIIGPPKSKMAEIRHLENQQYAFSAEGGPIWIKFRRLVQNDMSTAVIWPKSKPEVEFQYGGRLGEFNGMLSHSQVSRCRVGLLPLGEFTVVRNPRATCHITWRNQCYDRATLQGVRIPSAILKIVFFCHILFIFWFS